jgi:hypothetical protein
LNIFQTNIYLLLWKILLLKVVAYQNLIK